MLKKVNFFQNIVKKEFSFSKSNFPSRKKIQVKIKGEYISIDKDNVNYYKFTGILMALKIRNNFKYVLLKNKVEHLNILFLINLNSPLIYKVKIF